MPSLPESTCLSEKPISNVPAVADELVGAAAAADLKMAMVHNYHFLPEYRQIKKMLSRWRHRRYAGRHPAFPRCDRLSGRG